MDPTAWNTIKAHSPSDGRTGGNSFFGGDKRTGLWTRSSTVQNFDWTTFERRLVWSGRELVGPATGEFPAMSASSLALLVRLVGIVGRLSSSKRARLSERSERADRQDPLQVQSIPL